MNKRTMAFAYLILAATLPMLAACTQTVGHFTPTTATSPGNTVLYIYRPAASTPGVMKPLKFAYPDILIDGVSIGALKYDQYLVTELTPGPHTITVTGLTAAAKGWADRDIETVIPANRSDQSFMKLLVEYDTRHMVLFDPGPKYTIKLIPVASNDAQYEIRNTKRGNH